jgi:lysozyme
MSAIQLATAIIKRWEGCKLTAYQCSAGVWTIGYGSTFYDDGKPVKKGDKITQLRAETLLNHTVTFFHAKVDGLVTSAVNDNQLAALVSFAFNVGLSLIHI